MLHIEKTTYHQYLRDPAWMCLNPTELKGGIQGIRDSGIKVWPRV